MAEKELDEVPIMMLLDLFRDQGLEAFIEQTIHDLLTRLYALGAAYCVVDRSDYANLGALFSILADERAHFNFRKVSTEYADTWKERQDGGTQTMQGL